ncbi:type I 3-dehydroquinate dehydratase [Candidatus Bathyarchaeota archaeon]|nr:type I 3-dehydroquinate dehydratase [Candidatus Bathyarchaeota archaeon]
MSTNQVINQINQACEVDLIEVRLDYRRAPIDLDDIRASTGKPLIATNRRRDQGGQADEPEKDRVQLLLDALHSGFEYVDLAYTTSELEKTIKRINSIDGKVISSYHDFEISLTLDRLMEIHDELSSMRCDLVKIIGWANCYMDNVPYMEYNKAKPGNISFAMGEKGAPSRILAPLSGAAFTYASPSEGLEVAPGQISLRELRGIYGVLSK